MDLTTIPKSGASKGDIAALKDVLPRAISKQHEQLLLKWNGADLDVIRIYGCQNVEANLSFIAEKQFENPINGGIAFGDDPTGFIYLEADDGKVYSLDTVSGNTQELASDLEDFFSRLLFGEDASLFGGDDWKAELQDAGVL